MSAEQLSKITFFATLACALASAIPTDVRTARAPGLYLPLFGLVVGFIYLQAEQAALPPETVPIRIDLAFVLPAFGFLASSTLIKWSLFFKLQGIADRSPQRGLQLLLAFIAGVACLVWFASMWF